MRIQASQKVNYIQIQKGHASINITLDIYGHLFSDADFNRQQEQHVVEIIAILPRGDAYK
jgi:integrase